MNIDLNITELVVSLLDKYGVAGAALLFCLYSYRNIAAKLDSIADLSNKSFGVMLAIVKKGTGKDD